MSIMSRVLVAGLISVGLVGLQAAPTVARAQGAAPTGGDDQSAGTGSRLAHASKCVMSLGLLGGCDKDAPRAKAPAKAVDQKDGDRPALTRASTVTGADDQGASTRSRLAHASKCVVSLGFIGGCDKDAPAASQTGPRADAAPDTSRRGQLARASKCVISFGFLGDCDKK